MIYELLHPAPRALKFIKRTGLFVAAVHAYVTLLDMYPWVLITTPLMCGVWGFIAFAVREVELLLLNGLFLVLWLYALYNYFYLM